MKRKGLRNLLVFAFLAMAVCSSPAHAEEQQVVEIWPKAITLQGFVVLKRFYGPPNGGDEPKTDRKISNWLLILPEPVSARFKDHVISDVGRVSLYAETAQAKEFLKGHVGQEVGVTGTLAEAPNGSWYWARLSFSVKKAALLPRSTDRNDPNLGIWDFE